jgi:hypothetical protein
LIRGKLIKTMIRSLESQLQLNIKMCLPINKNIHLSSFDSSNIKNQIATYAKQGSWRLMGVMAQF